jgi:hypothetical protein
MLVLFETPAGFALFKVLDEGKLSKVEVIGSATSLLPYPCLCALVPSRCLFGFVG